MRARTRRLPVVAALALLAVALGACSAGGEPDASGSRPVEFTALDGVTLQGRLFGDGTTAVVLSHMRPADQRSWFDFARRLADAGYLVLTYNFRGYCPGGDGGCSEGSLDVGALWQDVAGAVELVRAEGAGEVALVGASMGGTASLVAAGRGAVQVEAVITLSAPAAVEGLIADAALLSNLDAVKVFVAGVGDAAAAADAQALHDLAPPPKRVTIFPSDDHGTDLLNGGRGEEVKRLIETTLAQLAEG
jgi:pimeloyl-ACP methyl ester carboxylesterase